MTGLESFRRRLDGLDEEITRLLGERFEVCREIALYKRANGVPMMQPDRVAEVRARYRARGVVLQLPADFTGALMDSLSEEQLMEMLSDEDLIEAPPVEPNGDAA